MDTPRDESRPSHWQQKGSSQGELLVSPILTTKTARVRASDVRCLEPLPDGAGHLAGHTTAAYVQHNPRALRSVRCISIKFMLLAQSYAVLLQLPMSFAASL